MFRAVASPLLFGWPRIKGFIANKSDKLVFLINRPYNSLGDLDKL